MKNLLLSVFLLASLSVVACGPWWMPDRALNDYGHFYCVIDEKSYPDGLDAYIRGFMTEADSLERADETYQYLVSQYSQAGRMEFDPWYYPASREEEYAKWKQSYAGVLESCRMKRTSGNGHILWLEAKCLYKMHRYEDCIAFCDSVLKTHPSRYLTARLELWQAGAKLQCGKDTVAAYKVFYRYGDISSAKASLYVAAKNGCPVELLDFAYMADHVHSVFDSCQLPYPFSGFDGWLYEDEKELKKPYLKLKKECEAIAQRSPRHVASWYYTAALCAHVCHQPREADRLLSKAERCHMEPEEVLPVKLLRMKLNLKAHGIRNERDERAFWDLYTALPQEVAYAQFHKEAIYYVIPQFARRGRHDQVMRFAELFDQAEGRSSWLMDEVVYGFVDMDAAAKYALTSARKDQIFDLLGTRCLRNMQYQKAVEYLSKVSPRYSRADMVWEYERDDLREELDNYYRRDPFDISFVTSLTKKKLKCPISQYRLKFAQQMVRLENEIKTCEDPNLRADYMARYATGMRNSFYHCWILTALRQSGGYECGNVDPESMVGISSNLNHLHYNPYSTSSDCRDMRDFYKWQKTTRATMEKKSKQIYRQALATYTDPDRAAALLHSLAMFKTIMKKYPNSASAQVVRAHCDNYKDYFSIN